MTTHARLTPHQKSTLARLNTLAQHARDGWVLAKDSGAPAALEHLMAKGYAARKEEVGPRGGRILYYRPGSYVETPRVYAMTTGEIDSKICFARITGKIARVFCGVQEFRGYIGQGVHRHPLTDAVQIEIGQRRLALNAITRVEYA